MSIKKTEIIIRKHENLVMAKHKLSRNAQKAYSLMLSTIKSTDADFKDHWLNYYDFATSVGSGNKDARRDLEKICKELNSVTLKIPQEDNSILFTSLVSSAMYYPDTGALRFRIDPALAPYLLSLKDRYLKYDIQNILRLKSKYSIKLYEVLKHYINKKKSKKITLDFTLEEFRKLLDIPKSYKYSDINNRILKESVEDFKKTDLSFSYIPIKRGRSVHSIEIEVFENKIDLPY